MEPSVLNLCLHRDSRWDFLLSNTISLNRENCCPPYCECEFSQFFPFNSRNNLPDFLACRCGENILGNTDLEWVWEEYSDSDVLVDGQNVTFHPVYSQGTAIVRGNKPLQPNMVHFWEMRIMTVMSGTEVMFGIGTDEVNLSKYNFHFVSALGLDNQSWGFSYTGKIQHDGKQTQYGQRFSQGCIIGIYLDRVLGHMEYYLNRRPLGIAFTGIPTNVKLYPMICSTTAKSAVRLINSISEGECLQFRAFCALTKQPQQMKQLANIPGFRRLVEKYFFLAPSQRYSNHPPVQREDDIRNEVVLSTFNPQLTIVSDDEMDNVDVDEDDDDDDDEDDDHRNEIDEDNDPSGFFYGQNVGNVYSVRPIRLGAQIPYESEIINMAGPNTNNQNHQAFDGLYDNMDDIYNMQ